MKYFSVTTVLNPFLDFSRVDPKVLRKAAERGTIVHNVCLDKYAAGFPVFVQKLPEEIRGYFLSFKQWFDQYVEKVHFIEREFVDHIFCFTGKIDLGVRLTDGRDVIADLKTPVSDSPTWKAQIAAYRHLVNIADIGIQFPADACLSLRARRNGKIAIATGYQYADDDFAAFISALNAYRYFKT